MTHYLDSFYNKLLTMEKKKEYTNPSTSQSDLFSSGLLAVSGGTSGYEQQPGEDDVNFEQRRRNIWDADDWLKFGSDKDNKEE